MWWNPRVLVLKKKINICSLLLRETLHRGNCIKKRKYTRNIWKQLNYEVSVINKNFNMLIWFKLRAAINDEKKFVSQRYVYERISLQYIERSEEKWKPVRVSKRKWTVSKVGGRELKSLDRIIGLNHSARKSKRISKKIREKNSNIRS